MERSLALTGARLIDGTGREPLDDACVLIEGGEIKAVGGKTEVRVPDGARVIQAEGKTVMPGLVDPEVHLSSGPPPTDDAPPGDPGAQSRSQRRPHPPGGGDHDRERGLRRKYGRQDPGRHCRGDCRRAPDSRIGKPRPVHSGPWLHALPGRRGASGRWGRRRAQGRARPVRGGRGLDQDQRLRRDRVDGPVADPELSLVVELLVGGAPGHRGRDARLRHEGQRARPVQRRDQAVPGGGNRRLRARLNPGR